MDEILKECYKEEERLALKLITIQKLKHYYQMEQDVINKAREIGCPENFALAIYILKLEKRIDELESYLDSRIENLAMHHERHVDRHESGKLGRGRGRRNDDD